MKSTKWKRSSKQNEKQPLITDIFLDLFIVHNFLTDSYVGKSPINYSHLLGNIFLLVRTFFRQASKSRQVNPRRFFFSLELQGACETASHWSSALELLHQMEMEEISPNIRSFNSAMRSCEEEEWEKAIVLFDMLRVFDLENIGKRQKGWDVWSSHNKRHPQTQTHKHTLVGWKQITEKEKGCFFFFFFKYFVNHEFPSI